MSIQNIVEIIIVSYICKSRAGEWHGLRGRLDLLIAKYLQLATQYICAKFGANPSTRLLCNWVKHNDFKIYLYLLFQEIIRWLVFACDGSNDAESRRGVPFGSQSKLTIVIEEVGAILTHQKYFYIRRSFAAKGAKNFLGNAPLELNSHNFGSPLNESSKFRSLTKHGTSNKSWKLRINCARDMPLLGVCMHFFYFFYFYILKFR